MNPKEDAMDLSQSSLCNYSNIFSSTSTNLPNDDNEQRTMIQNEENKLAPLIQVFNETIEENNALNEEMYELFSRIGIKKSKFSNVTKELLEKLRSIDAEDLFDADEMTFRLNLIHKSIEERKKKKDEKELKIIYDNFFKNFNNVDKKLQTLSHAIEKLESHFLEESQSIENANNNQTFLNNKICEYEKNLKQIQVEVVNMNVKDISSSNILKKSAIYTEKKAELSQLNKELGQYADLPPDLLQAKAMLDDKIKEYKRLKNEIDKSINK